MLGNSDDSSPREIIYLSVKKWLTAQEIDRKRCLHIFSRLRPSNLLYSMCSILTAEGIHYTIGEDKMRVTFTKENPINVLW